MIQGLRVGYKRVSSEDQNPDRQLENIKLDKVFLDKYTGTLRSRPQFDELMNYLREGDRLIVHSIDRMARNLDHLREIVKTLTEKGVIVEFVKEGLVFSKDDQSPMSRLILSIIGAISEFEHALIKERQREGVALARARGVYGGRPKVLSKVEIDHLKEMVSSGIPKTQAAKKLGIARESVYTYLK